jgi:hypothetical protein
MLDGSAWDDGRCHKRALRACRNLEKLHNLTRVESIKPEKKQSLDKTEKSKARNAKKAGKTQPPNKLTLQGWIDEILSKNKKISAPEFVASLMAKGVLVRPNMTSSGRLNGFSFGVDGIAHKGSDLGRAYSLRGLIDRGLSYDPDRDAEALKTGTSSSIQTTSLGLDGYTRQAPETSSQEVNVQPSSALSPDETIRLAIDLKLRSGPQSTVEFVRGLAASGIRVTAALAKNGRLSGFRFLLSDGDCRKGSELGSDYALAGLLRRGLTYEWSQAAELKAAIKAASSKVMASQRGKEIGLDWPDTIIPVRNISKQISSEAFRNFVRGEGLIFWRDQNTSDMIFYHRGRKPKGERQGIAFVDRGYKIDVRITTEDNILKALKYGELKWGSVKITGSLDFVSRAEALARANGILLGQDLAVQPRFEVRNAPRLGEMPVASHPSSSPAQAWEGQAVSFPAPKNWKEALSNVYNARKEIIQEHLPAHIYLADPIISQRLQKNYSQYLECRRRIEAGENGLDEFLDSSINAIEQAITAHDILEILCEESSLLPSEESSRRAPMIRQIESDIWGETAMEEATEQMPN